MSYWPHFSVSLLAACCLVVSGCSSEQPVASETIASTADPGESASGQLTDVELEGLYTSSFERSAFKPCNINEVWWAYFRTGDPEAMSVAMGIDPDAPDWDSIHVANRYLRVRGDVERAEETGHGFGHMGKYQGLINITAILETREATGEEIQRCRRA